jgi:hypothetical protein
LFTLTVGEKMNVRSKLMMSLKIILLAAIINVVSAMSANALPLGGEPVPVPPVHKAPSVSLVNAITQIHFSSRGLLIEYYRSGDDGWIIDANGNGTRLDSSYAISYVANSLCDLSEKWNVADAYHIFCLAK